ncbi:Threonine/homoserine efflux transporter RhtA [Cohaesibacter sp. ES.047]|uniref:DMT family transporter n=1 Tax=Cohaesibacter sp. ES.047 TaxID=1798205 RepID=UPI000BB840CF|nr:DMT family transporter [Cohaesibacter sp. ES.047]SNY93937.1 Threonine/homoserine efflux transporter RhtA [Cohaesibacter sp. ES.047]
MPPHAIRKPTPGDISILFFLTLIWASSFVAIKVAVPFTGPVWLAGMRVCIGFLVLIPWTLYRGLVLPTSPRTWMFLIGVSLLNITMPFLLISWAELSISAGITSLLLATGPFIALVLSHLTTEDDKINIYKLIGIALGLTGVATVVGGEAISNIGDSSLLAQLAVLGASLCYGVSGAMIRQIKDVPPTRLATIILGLSSIELLALGFYQGLPDFGTLDTQAWFALLYLGLLPTGLATILRYRMIWTVGASYFGLFMNLIPIFGVLMGAVLLSEHVAVSTVFALFFIVAGLFVARTNPARPSR